MSQPNDAHLMLEITIENGETWCGYYYASASSQSLFWLQPYDISEHIQVRGDVLSPSHINVVTSFSATVYETPERLREMNEIVKGAMGRFMMRFANDRFLNYYGQYGARLNYTQSVHGNEKRKRTWLIRLLSPLLFVAPNVHLKALDELWVDEIAIRVRCLNFFVKLTTQWGEHIVHASILLNANVAFLAIPSNDPSNNSGVILPYRTSAQIASYLSVVASFASMLLALMLVRAHKNEIRDDWDVIQYHPFSPISKDIFNDIAILSANSRA
ncbi:hypothetical protein H0H92_014017 [Tricholoma furcatifolium]|nr:hypothetical protein H0H92_014017 [Tricholoma furcatifolium]